MYSRSLLVVVLFLLLGSFTSSAFLSSSSFKASAAYLPTSKSLIFTTALSTTRIDIDTSTSTNNSNSNSNNSNISKNKNMKEKSDTSINMSTNGVIRISYHELKNQTPRAIAAAKEAFCNHNHHRNNKFNNDANGNGNENGNGNGNNCCYGALAIYDIQVHQSDLNMNMNVNVNVNNFNRNKSKNKSKSKTPSNTHHNLILDWKSQREKIMNIGAQLALDPSPPAKQARRECKCAGDDDGDGNGNENIRVGPGWSGTPGNEQHSLQSGFYANIKDVIKDRDGDGDGIDDNGIGRGQKGEEDEIRVWGDNRWPKDFKQSNKERDNFASTSVPQQSSPGEEQDFETCVSSAAAIMHHVTLSTLDLAHKAANEIMQEMSLTKQQQQQNGNSIGEDGDDRVETKGTATEIQSQIKDIEGCIPNLRHMAEQSNFLPARLVYYDAKFSREDTTIINSNSTKNNRENSQEYKYWLPWHVDFNLATAFAPAMWIHEESALNGYGHDTDTDDNSKYLETKDESQSQLVDDEHLQTDEQYYESSDTNPEHHAGLLLRTSDGDIVPAALEDDCILVQLGAHAQLATGGILRAGPHAVGKFGKHKDTHCAQSIVNAQSQTQTSSITHDGMQNGRLSLDQFIDDSYGRLSFGLFVYGPWSARMKPSDELLNAMGIKGAGDGRGHYKVKDEDEEKDDIVGDDFGGLMKKAYTGETVLEGYQKFEAYMNGK